MKKDGTWRQVQWSSQFPPLMETPENCFPNIATSLTHCWFDFPSRTRDWRTSNLVFRLRDQKSWFQSIKLTIFPARTRGSQSIILELVHWKQWGGTGKNPETTNKQVSFGWFYYSFCTLAKFGFECFGFLSIQNSAQVDWHCSEFKLVARLFTRSWFKPILNHSCCESYLWYLCQSLQVILWTEVPPICENSMRAWAITKTTEMQFCLSEFPGQKRFNFRNSSLISSRNGNARKNTPALVP